LIIWRDAPQENKGVEVQGVEIVKQITGEIPRNDPEHIQWCYFQYLIFRRKINNAVIVLSPLSLVYLGVGRNMSPNILF